MQKNSLLQEFDYPLTSENVDEAEPNISWHVVTPDLLLVPELPHTVRGDVHDVGEPVPHTQTWQGGQEMKGEEEEKLTCGSPQPGSVTVDHGVETPLLVVENLDVTAALRLGLTKHIC